MLFGLTRLRLSKVVLHQQYPLLQRGSLAAVDRLLPSAAAPAVGAAASAEANGKGPSGTTDTQTNGQGPVHVLFPQPIESQRAAVTVAAQDRLDVVLTANRLKLLWLYVRRAHRKEALSTK